MLLLLWVPALGTWEFSEAVLVFYGMTELVGLGFRSLTPSPKPNPKWQLHPCTVSFWLSGGFSSAADSLSPAYAWCLSCSMQLLVQQSSHPVLRQYCAHITLAIGYVTPLLLCTAMCTAIVPFPGDCGASAHRVCFCDCRCIGLKAHNLLSEALVVPVCLACSVCCGLYPLW